MMRLGIKRSDVATKCVCVWGGIINFCIVEKYMVQGLNFDDKSYGHLANAT